MTAPLRHTSPPRLHGRRRETELLEGLVGSVRAGHSGTLVVRGEAGIGKTALMDHVAKHSGCLVLRSVGVEHEMELAYAGLHALCAPMLDRLDGLPAPQREALGGAFGLTTDESVDAMALGLGVLSLLSHVAQEQSLVCIVDDAQWLDTASARVLAFVGRRIDAGPVGLMIALREPSDVRWFDGLPELSVGGLAPSDARELLASVLLGPVDDAVISRVIAEASGNPLALIELADDLTQSHIVGGIAAPSSLRLAGPMADRLRQQLQQLPPDTQQLLLIAAAEPAGEPSMLWDAADRLGIHVEAALPAEDAGLVQFTDTVRFRPPLARPTVYQMAPLAERQRVHLALAEVTDGDADPDRRAWHIAHSAVRPDETVAAELELAAGRARARGQLAAAAAFLERSVALSPETDRRNERAVLAARAKLEAGAPAAASDLLATAESGPLDELARANLELLRGQIAFRRDHGRDAPALLLSAASSVAALDARLSREAYLEALWAAINAGHLGDGHGVVEVARAALEAPRPHDPPRVVDLLLDALAALCTDGYPAAAPALKRALSAASDTDEVRWLEVACSVAMHLWDDRAVRSLSARHEELARSAGAMTILPTALDQVATANCLLTGDLAAASALIEEVDRIRAVMESPPIVGASLALAAIRGDVMATAELIESIVPEATARGEGMSLTQIAWHSAVLNNGLGRYSLALAAAREAIENAEHVAGQVLPELVEAAARSGEMAIAADALERLCARTRASGTGWALGVEARCRALLAEDHAAEELFRQAIERLDGCNAVPDLARSRLLYGEWLRRLRRRVDARTQLRMAYQSFAVMGAHAFAERAARELLATGEHSRKRSVETLTQLTPQESQIAKLARDGNSNPEIGARLYISPRTVEYHLHKVFTKLSIRSRNELHGAMSPWRQPRAASSSRSTGVAGLTPMPPPRVAAGIWTLAPRRRE